MLITDENFKQVWDTQFNTVTDRPNGLWFLFVAADEPLHDTTPNPKRNSVYDNADRADVNETPLPSQPKPPHKPAYFAGDDPYNSMPNQRFLNNARNN